MPRTYVLVYVDTKKLSAFLVYQVRYCTAVLQYGMRGDTYRMPEEPNSSTAVTSCLQAAHRIPRIKHGSRARLVRVALILEVLLFTNRV